MWIRAAAAGAALVTTPVAAETPQASHLSTEVRGLQALDSAIVWAGARRGWVARTADGGATWTASTVPDAGTLFFVDVAPLTPARVVLLGQAFDGGLARLYLSENAGASWRVAWESRHPDIFLDGLAFWDARYGVAFGDPVDGVFTVLRTEDGGASWEPVPADAIPTPLRGEAGFAASGTAITTAGSRHAWIVTGGGDVARVLRTTDRGRTWRAAPTPLAAGGTAGLFGVAFRDTMTGLAVGGDYTRPEDTAPNVLRTDDGGVTWTLVGTSAPAGVRWGLAWSPGRRAWIGVGPSGVGVTADGATWRALDLPGFNTVTAAGDAVWMAGSDGRLLRLPSP